MIFKMYEIKYCFNFFQMFFSIHFTIICFFLLKCLNGSKLHDTQSVSEQPGSQQVYSRLLTFHGRSVLGGSSTSPSTSLADTQVS